MNRLKDGREQERIVAGKDSERVGAMYIELNDGGGKRRERWQEFWKDG